MWPTTNNFGCSVKVILLRKLLTLPCNVLNSEGNPPQSNYIDITGLLTDGVFGHVSHLKVSTTVFHNHLKVYVCFSSEL